MPGGPASNGADGGAAPHLSLWHRFLAALPHLRGEDGESVGQRVKASLVKPADPDAPAKAKSSGLPETVEELEAANRYADDKERIVGLFAAPLAGALGLIVTGALIAADPASVIDGHANPKHVDPSVYGELRLVLLGLALAMLVTAWMRKRLLLGMVMALYGLALFNLHGWGFAIPFLLYGSWLLVRAYRIHSALKTATEAAGGGEEGLTARPVPRPNKRYTPPPPKRSTPKKPPPSKPENEQKAG